MDPFMIVCCNIAESPQRCVALQLRGFAAYPPYQSDRHADAHTPWQTLTLTRTVHQAACASYQCAFCSILSPALSHSPTPLKYLEYHIRDVTFLIRTEFKTVQAQEAFRGLVADADWLAGRIIVD